MSHLDLVLTAGQVLALVIARIAGRLPSTSLLSDGKRISLTIAVVGVVISCIALLRPQQPTTAPALLDVLTRIADRLPPPATDS